MSKTKFVLNFDKNKGIPRKNIYYDRTEKKHMGFVELVEVSPAQVPEGYKSDVVVVQAARTSTNTDLKDPVRDRRLMTFMYGEKHSTPFEFVHFTYRIQVPLYVANQLVRHRAQSVNSLSLRYSEAIDEFFIPEPRSQDVVNKQGSLETNFDDKTKQKYYDLMIKSKKDAFSTYKQLIDMGVAREIARSVLPVNFMTRMTVSYNLRNLLHMLNLRMAPDAQKEIREMANAMCEMIKEYVPDVYKAFQNFTLNAEELAEDEINAIREYMENKTMPNLKNKRRTNKLIDKMKKMGIFK